MHMLSACLWHSRSRGAKRRLLPEVCWRAVVQLSRYLLPWILLSKVYWEIRRGGRPDKRVISTTTASGIF